MIDGDGAGPRMCIQNTIDLPDRRCLSSSKNLPLAQDLYNTLMAAAYLMAHGTQAPLSIENMWELAALYTFVFLYIASQGSGIWSVDATCISI